MKFVLVPLLIVGMFVSFAAALLALLFWDGTIKNMEELKDLILDTVDSSRLPDELRLKEDQLDSLFRQAEDYSGRWQTQLETLEAREGSLAREATLLKVTRDSLVLARAAWGLTKDSLLVQQREEGLARLAKYYNAMKPAAAAEVLQEESVLSDTMVARILDRVEAGRAAKIMGYMNPDFAANITKLMQEL